MERMIDPERALRLVLEAAPPPRVVTLDLAQAGGLVLAETVSADRDYPPFDRVMMDGYAVRLADAGRTVEVAGEVAAGQAPRREQEVAPGRCLAVNTGAPAPPGTEAVVMKERARVEQGRVTLPPTIAAGQHIAGRGSELAAEAPALERGTRLTPLGVAVLASLGRRAVRVLAPPELAIIATGSELVDVDAAPGEAQIRDSNGPMLAAQAARLSLPPPRMQRARDTAESLRRTLARVADADVVLLSGGVSAGSYDLVPGALRDFGAELVFHKVTQKPGKPLLLGRRDRQLLLGLPGNPLSTHFCWHRYVVPAARKMMGWPAEARDRRGTLAAPLRARSERTLFLLARAERDDGRWLLHPRVGQGSADIFASVDADAYLRLEPGEHRLEPGAAVSFQWIGERS